LPWPNFHTSGEKKGDNREIHNPIGKWNPAISTILVLATKFHEGTQNKRGKEEEIFSPDNFSCTFLGLLRSKGFYSLKVHFAGFL
jgi:hypothetical protein